ncbi:mitochondrial amidoxime-reducing component 1-like [Anoplophora glabripennis]|uniref:mitochondrial amidoxime-reducing component 1-like n=1 Tax=Anoplophora glabripennis TaxID=217634 RepID=UPI0008754D5C|nr:mitochondrial amidoxime-reducing component 1-like [Anoplophora glabripennis]
MAHNAIFSQHTIVAAGILTVAATTLGTYYYFSSKFKKSKFPNEWRAVGEVRKLCIYPFKSGKKLEVDQAECTKRGLMEEEKFDKSFRLRDRSFVVYNEKSHKYVNSRHYPKMVLVEVRAEHMNHVLLNAPNMNTLLLQIPDRTRNKEVVGLYSDLTSILLLNQASVNDLNKRIGNSSVTVLNFRPNFVVDGPDLAPYAEDSWEWVKIGNVVLRNVKECTRCIMTTINPENASRSSDMEPLKTLKKYRLSNGPSKVPIMGIHLEVKRPGSIKVGDPVYVAKSLE